MQQNCLAALVLSLGLTVGVNGPASAAQFWAVSITKHTMGFMDLDAIEEPEWGERSFTMHNVYDQDEAARLGIAGGKSELMVTCDNRMVLTTRMMLVSKAGKAYAPWNPNTPPEKPSAGSMGDAWVDLACTGKLPKGLELMGPWPSLDAAQAFYFANPAH